VGELRLDARAQHVGHVQDLGVDRVVGRDVGLPVLAEVRDDLLGRQVEVVAHHLLGVGGGPVLGVGAAQEGGDLVGVGNPALVGGVLLGGVAGGRRADEVGGDQDVIAQQRGQLAAGGI